MIPTLIVFGLAFGRWWRVTLLVATVGWPVVLLASGIIEPEPQTLALAAGLAFVNTVVGVGVYQAVLFAYRRLRDREHARQLGR